MSYGLSCNCGRCANKIMCVDSSFVQAAINGIHSVNWANGVEKKLHLGSGIIEIKCTTFKDEEEAANNK